MNKGYPVKNPTQYGNGKEVVKLAQDKKSFKHIRSLPPGIRVPRIPLRLKF